MTATSQRPQLQYLHNALEDLKAANLYYRLKVLEGEQKPVANFDGKEVINLSSNNYLGLTTHPKLRRAAIDATRKFGVGSGAVRTIAGTMKAHLDLEKQIAEFKKVEACVVFQSGFAANAGTVAAILGKEDLVISDELNHASIIDGCRLSRATIKVFKHKDAADCRRVLARSCSSPTASSQWMATSPTFRRSAIWPRNTAAS
jgi:glycine C-acetyltransferase